MATSTYEAIGAVTITTGVNRISFNNIPATYTDLELVFSGTNSPDYDIAMQFNGDNATFYSANRIYGSGSGGGASDRGNNETYFAITIGGAGNPGPARVSINNYATNQQYKTVVTRSVYPSNYVGMSAKLWRKLNPINSITIIGSGSSTLQVGSVISLYGIGANSLKASGGNAIMTDGTYWYHAFTSAGTFTPNSTLSCDVLVVGGGGGGGCQMGGGGGAGGVFYATSQSISTAKTIVIGAGGNGGSVSVSKGTSGSNSTFGSLTAGVGGGGGGSLGTGLYDGISGGSGGGGGSGATNGTGGSATQTGTGGTGYGFAGGSGNNPAGGGGGGAGAIGGNAGGGQGGDGGSGLNTWSLWLNTTGLGVSGYIAGGGSGGSNSVLSIAGGAGGGGSGGGSTLIAPQSGMPNTGGGGGGSRDKPDAGESGGRGGSGLVMVRYAV